MKAYVITTGVVFGLLTSVHVWRLFEEGRRLLEDPFWVIATIVAAVLSVWAWRLVWVARR